ncbi:MAG: cell division protein FtsZ [Verrucomicrobiota bacterium]
METNLNPESTGTPAEKKLLVKIFGVGGAGITVLDRLAAAPLPGASFCALSADAESLQRSTVTERISVETKLLRGLGTGGDPERGTAAAEEFFPTLKDACSGVSAVFIVAGLGGGAGTGIAPVLARAAKEAGALVLAFVTLPFECEGNRRQTLARNGLEKLKAVADGVICLPNQKLFKLIDENTSVVDMFKATAGLLADGVNGVWGLMVRQGLIEIHFADLCALLRNRHGESSFATAQAAGETRSREALDQLFAHPMLDGGKVLAESDAVLVSLTGGPDLTMAEVNRVMQHVQGKCPLAQVIMGAAIDEAFRDRLAITLVVNRPAPAAKRAPAAISDAVMGDDLETTERPQSRFVPPPPAISPEDARKIYAGKTPGGRARKSQSKMSQGTLQLEIISKGRFDKSEPTYHKGEDLDVPTYIRRGVSLN